MKKISLKKVRNTPRLWDSLRWDIIPTAEEPVKIDQSMSTEKLLQINQQRKDQEGVFFCIEIFQGQASVLLRKQGKAVNETLGEIEDIPDSILRSALADCGAPLKEDAFHPINEELQNYLQRNLR